MATARRKPGTPLTEALQTESFSFDFYQAVRLLEAMRPEAESVGRSPYVRDEAVRFRSEISLAFPVSEISSISVPESDGEPAEVKVAFMGIGGLQGPLPRVFTELILREMSGGAHYLPDFLDIFNHRLLSLLYRTREKHRVGARIQEPDQGRLASWLYCIAGLGTGGLRDRMVFEDADEQGGVRDRAFLPFAGLLSAGPRSAVSLQQMLRAYFGHQVSVRQFVGCWRPLREDQWTKLGTAGGANHRLGDDALLGRRVWDQDGVVVVEIGPLSLREFRRFLPGTERPGMMLVDGDAYRASREFVRFHVGEDRDTRIELRLARDEVPPTRISAAVDAPRLGYTSWLSTGPMSADPRSVPVR